MDSKRHDGVAAIARDRFGWAGRSVDDSAWDSGTKIDDLVAGVVADLREDRAVALGFECPLFVPHPREPVELTRAWKGEGSRAWSAGAGAGALAVGLTETAWVLSMIHEQVRPEPPLFVAWPEFIRAAHGIFLWEAFVTGGAKGVSHEDDAGLAARSFVNSLPDPTSSNLIDEPSVLSLVAGSALRAGWRSAAAMIDKPCLVLGA